MPDLAAQITSRGGEVLASFPPDPLAGFGAAYVVHGNARAIPLPDNSVDAIVCSPPYFALRSYQDGGVHYEGQIGAEPTPAEYVNSLIAVTRECVRVLKPSGSLFVNLGDKYVADNRGSSSDVKRGEAKYAPRGPAGYPTGGMRQKSLMGIPWRYALRCIDTRQGVPLNIARRILDDVAAGVLPLTEAHALLDEYDTGGVNAGLGLILRAEVIWAKLNGLPESVTDRVRRSHEQWFHFTAEPRYYASIDEIREPHAPQSLARTGRGYSAGDGFSVGQPNTLDPEQFCNPLGKLPGSVRTVATEPLVVPDHIAHALCCDGKPRRDGAGKITCEDGVDHYAAFPSEWPRFFIQGWAPRDVCTACGEGRAPVSVSEPDNAGYPNGPGGHARERSGFSAKSSLASVARHLTTITGYACECNEPIATPTGAGRDPDPSRETGRAGFNRPRGDDEGVRWVTRWEQRHEAAQLRDSEHRAAMAAEAGSAFAHYIRTDASGARPIPEPLRVAWRNRGWLTPVPPFVPPPSTPGVVLDVFGGTGTTAMVARALGYTGITLDASRDYGAVIAAWRVGDSDGMYKVRGVTKPDPVKTGKHPDQLGLFDGLFGD